MNVLVLNAGSSSLKFQMVASDERRLLQNVVETKDIHSAVEQVFGLVRESSMAVEAVGHRVVHGGDRFSESVVISPDVLQGIRECVDLAPLHNPANIECIEAAQKFFGTGVPQVAVFDTAFHHAMPEHAYLYAVPYEWYEKHRVRRYGFHGTSHRYVAERYAELREISREDVNVISLHLGNGCSIAAIKGGKSIDTSMGLTPLEGLVMGTRSGDVDPGVLRYVAEKEGLSPDALDEVLNHKSGLLGISGVTGDMRKLQKDSGPRARSAIDVFCYRAKKYIGSYLAAMGGADALIFTGGIGEHASDIRARICSGMEWAGLEIEEARNVNGSGEARISTEKSKLAAYCIPTDEELLIARDTVRLVSAA